MNMFYVVRFGTMFAIVAVEGLRVDRSLPAITAYSTELKNLETMTANFAMRYSDNAKMYRNQLETMKKSLDA